jgi:hypothetical protein
MYPVAEFQLISAVTKTMVADLVRFCASSWHKQQHDKAPNGALSDFRLLVLSQATTR